MTKMTVDQLRGAMDALSTREVTRPVPPFIIPPALYARAVAQGLISPDDPDWIEGQLILLSSEGPPAWLTTRKS
jgi:hypothetical protein